MQWSSAATDFVLVCGVLTEVMSRSSKNPLDYRQSPSSLSNYPASSGVRSAHSSPIPDYDNRSTRRFNASPESPRTSNTPLIKTVDGRSSRSPINVPNENDDRTLRRLLADQPFNPPPSRLSEQISLRSVVIDGKWKFRGDHDDDLRLKSMGIANLVAICHDVMNETLEASSRMFEKRRKSPLRRESSPWPIVKLEPFKKLTNSERMSLQRAHLLNLMTIVYQAAATSASISQLVRIWREVGEHHRRPRRPQVSNQPTISYPIAFEHLIRQPNNELLRIFLHAALISSHSRKDLRRLGDQLGVQRSQFDMGSIRESSEAFAALIHLLREERLRQRREQRRVDTYRVPYAPKKKRGLLANLSATKFPIVRQAVDVAGFTLQPDSDFTCHLLWNDSIISMDVIAALKPYQKVNHFMGMNEISRKDLLGKHYARFSAQWPQLYNFLPQSWLLPDEYHLWHAQALKKRTAYILKPIQRSSRQRIEIHCDVKGVPPMSECLIQEYLPEPYLIDGLKFDVRIYVLITSCDPLRVYIFNNGLVRFCREIYQIPTKENSSNRPMHLSSFAPDDDWMDIDAPKKLSLQKLFKYLGKQKQNIDALWQNIQDIVLRMIFLAEPHLLTAYDKSRPGSIESSESVCFELLGFDFLLDKNLKPWLIEVNRCPNLYVGEQIEFDVKIHLLIDMINLLAFRKNDRARSVDIEKAEAKRRLYSSLGKSDPHLHPTPLVQLKEDLVLLQQNKAREVQEREQAGGFLRLFPVSDDHRMNELMPILRSSFDLFGTHKDPSRWMKRYPSTWNEEELFHRIAQLESREPIRLPAPQKRDRSASPTKQISTQTPKDLRRAASADRRTKPRSSLVSTGDVGRTDTESLRHPVGAPAHRITEKKFYSTDSSIPSDRSRSRSSSPKSHSSNDKSQMVTQSSIIQATRIQPILNHSAPTQTIKQLQLTEADVDRLYRRIFHQLDKLRLHYPNRSDRETERICQEIFDHWDYHKPRLARFWFVELDGQKRESVVEIVWTQLQQLMKKSCLIDELVQELPLHRHLLTLRRRLLANKGQCLWDACQDQHDSWESMFVKSTHRVSPIEMDCCCRFVDLCREALFIVYHYSNGTHRV